MIKIKFTIHLVRKQ